MALTKCDLVDAARLQQVTKQARWLLAETGLAEAPMFPLSSVTGEGVAQLAAHLREAAAETAPRVATGHFRLAVDRRPWPEWKHGEAITQRQRSTGSRLGR